MFKYSEHEEKIEDNLLLLLAILLMIKTEGKD